MFSGPGFLQVYMRGVASGGDGNHSGSQPSVGVYLDEQPITTITGALDIHMYDIARVEALAGPQGTLYGASSQAGTLRIITNKPDADAASPPGCGVEVNAIDGGGIGHVLEGFVNVPLCDRRRDPPGRAGTSTTPATSTTCRARARSRPRASTQRQRPTVAEDNYNTPTPPARAPR